MPRLDGGALAAGGAFLIKPNCILITGASGSIGGALAREYAAPGVTLLLHGRNQALLNTLAMECEQRGAHARAFAFDVRDTARLQAWARQISAEMPLDLVIANAGMNIDIGAQGQGERWEDVEALLDTNVRAVLALVDAVLPRMRARRQGQIALVSSLAAYFGLPPTPSYCASKAAVKAYGEGLRGWLATEGIRVNVVMPGYVDSPMCEAMPGPKPFQLTAARAARAIRRGLQRNQARISFPFPLNLGTWFLAVLPAGVSIRIVRWMGYGG